MIRRIAQLSDEVKIASVAAFCLMALVVVLKNVLDVSPEVLSRDVIIYIIIYSGFWLLPSLTINRDKRTSFDSPLFWSLLIVAITAAIIALYAV